MVSEQRQENPRPWPSSHEARAIDALSKNILMRTEHNGGTPPPAAAFASIVGGGPDTGASPQALARRSKFLSAATYICIIALAFLAVIFWGSMNENSAAMSTEVAASAQLLSNSSLHANREKELEELALSETHEAEDLMKQAKTLAKSGVEDIEKANKDENKAKYFEDKAAQEQDEAKKLRAQADADGKLYMTVKANATALSAMAKKDNAAAEEGTVPGTSLCRLPFIHNFCGVLGAATKIKIRSEAIQRAAVEASEALDRYERAKDIREREDEEIMEAEEFEAHAKQDEEEAKKLEAQAKQEMNAGREEEKQAEKDQVDANADVEKSETEADQAKSFKGKARDERKRVDKMMERALKQGQNAYIYGILASIFAAIIIIFFSIRLIAKFGIGLYRYMLSYWMCLAHEQKCSLNRGVDVPEAAGRSWALFPKGDFFRFVVEYIGLLAAVATFATQWAHFEVYSALTRGGLVLVCALVAGAAQSMVIITLPALHAAIISLDHEYELLNGSAIRGIAVETLGYFVLSLTVSTTHSVLFILILWINMGPELFGNFTSYLNAPLMWLLFVLGSYVYLRCFNGAPDQASQSGAADISKFDSTITKEKMIRNQWLDNGIATESDVLLDRDWGLWIGEHEVIVAGSVDSISDEMDVLLDTSISISGADSSEASSYAKNRWETAMATTSGTLHFTFEVLVLSCMIAILRASVPKCRDLSSALGLTPVSWIFLSAAMCIVISCSAFKAWIIKRQRYQQ